MTVSRDITHATPHTYDDLVRLWELDDPTPLVGRGPRRRQDRAMVIAWCGALSAMATTFAALQWAIQAVGR